MQLLSLDFVKNAPPTKLGLGLLMIGTLLLSLSLWYWAQLQSKASSLNLELQALQTAEANQLKAQDIQKSSKNAAGSKQFSALNTLKPKLWIELLSHLELGMTDEVALLSIEPNAQTGKLQLVAEAKDYQAILVYMTALDESKALEDIHLVKHKVQLEVPGQPIYFSLSATWLKKHDT